MINEVIETLKAYTDGKDNAGKVEISVMQLNRIIKALEQQPTDAVDRVTIKEYLESFGKYTNVTAKENNNEQMTAEDYRQRMMKAFHNADCDGLIAVCVLPTEKEFEHLEWLLKNHYKKDPCEDCISRQEVLDVISELNAISFYEAQEDSKECYYEIRNAIKQLPSVTPQPKSGYISIADAMAAFNDFMCNDIEPEGQEVFLELLKDRAKRSEE